LHLLQPEKAPSSESIDKARYVHERRQQSFRRAHESDAIIVFLNWDDNIGSIEPGKFADLIAVKGDPLKDVTILEHVQFILKDGILFRNDHKKKGHNSD
jgi:predicted amidohydrolase YtcJ